MDLWIRSQDKELIQKVNTGIMYLKDATNRDCIANRDNETGFSILGAYETRERALEVLDEIEKIIQPPMNFIVSQHIDFDNDGEGLIGCNILKEEPKIERKSDIIVYEMPKE